MSSASLSRTTTTTDTVPVVIIGGGLAGLSAAAHLAGRGIPPVLLDADSLWAGGRLAGGDPELVAYQGRTWAFKPDHGVHGVWGGYVNMRALLQRFTDTQLIPSAGEEWINRWGRKVRTLEAGNAVRSRWIPAPFHHLQLLFHPQIWLNIQPWDFLSLPGVLASILMTVGVDPIKEQIAWDGLTMDDYFYLWTPNLRTTFEGLGVNLLAAPKDSISLAGFIAGLRFYTLLRRDAWAMSYMPADSHTSLIQPLLDHIGAAGGTVRAGVTARQLRRTPHGWQVVVEDDARGGLRALHTRQVIIATNAPAAQRLLCNSPDTATEAAHMIFPAGLNNTVVRLWFDAAPRPGTAGGMFTGDFAPDNFFWLHRLYDDYARWHADTGGSVIELHFYETDVQDQPDRNLLILAVSEVQRAFPHLQGHFVHGTVRRNSKVHTQFRVPTDETLQVRSRWAGIFACGDWVGYDTPSLWMERAATTGIAAANEVLSANGCEPYPILYPPKPELLARGLGGIVRGGRFALSPVVRVFAERRRRARS